MAVYLRAPNYVNNLKRLGFTDDDFVDGRQRTAGRRSGRPGVVDRAVDRVRAHFDAGASHVCVQILGDDLMAVPEGAWGDPAEALDAACAGS